MPHAREEKGLRANVKAGPARFRAEAAEKGFGMLEPGHGVAISVPGSGYYDADPVPGAQKTEKMTTKTTHVQWGVLNNNGMHGDGGVYRCVSVCRACRVPVARDVRCERELYYSAGPTVDLSRP